MDIMSTIYSGVETAATIGTPEFLICSAVSIVLGIVCAAVYMFRQNYSKSFVATVALLPLIVQMVITLVNGNIGAGIAVMGVFSLVRFRSIPGSAKDIGTVFFAMAIGLATGMGYIGLAALFTVIASIASIALTASPLGKEKPLPKTLRITAPEDIESEDVFNDIIEQYTSTYSLSNVSTANMGSLYKLEYLVTLKDGVTAKEMIDKLRCENGNLAISLITSTKKETL